MTCIVIVYNGEEFLEEAITSVVRQTSPDWELIVADDGSTDASREIARRHAEVDSRIRVVAHPDRRQPRHERDPEPRAGESRGRTSSASSTPTTSGRPTKIAEQLDVLGAAP